VINSIKITKRSDKKRNNITKFNSQKTVSGVYYSSLSPIQREIYDTQYNKEEEDGDQEPANKKK
jgi:hypothetical protein